MIAPVPLPTATIPRCEPETAAPADTVTSPPPEPATRIPSPASAVTLPVRFTATPPPALRASTPPPPSARISWPPADCVKVIPAAPDCARTNPVPEDTTAVSACSTAKIAVEPLARISCVSTITGPLQVKIPLPTGVSRHPPTGRESVSLRLDASQRMM